MIQETCDKCGGTGGVRAKNWPGYGGDVELACSQCGGSGRITRPFSSPPSDVGGPDAADLEVAELRRERDRARELLAGTEAQIAGLIRERDEAATALQNLLAVINGDGGHRSDTFPALMESGADGERSWLDLRARLEASEAELLRHKVLFERAEKDRNEAEGREWQQTLELHDVNRGAAAMRAALEDFRDARAAHTSLDEERRRMPVIAERMDAALASTAGTGFVPRAEMATEIDRLLENEDRLQKRAHVAGWNEAIDYTAEALERAECSVNTVTYVRALRKPDGGT